jgi:hypothetical protein
MNKLAVDVLDSVAQECEEALELIDLSKEKRVVFERAVNEINDIIKEAYLNNTTGNLS